MNKKLSIMLVDWFLTLFLIFILGIGSGYAWRMIHEDVTNIRFEGMQHLMSVIFLEAKENPTREFYINIDTNAKYKVTPISENKIVLKKESITF